ncbi:type VII toxin-antitoxin system HepT family RNase toxin [Mangrovibacillus cuniculi]|uniref:DUF86 domain-containing protein n=1 Tax=Mangrovibacillus cuniculi TaxID=2593652 RepID=A0A7S8CCG8_9BACI|nr:DUF86 domain-containing protein [Mangrovibacillus cuniculi]QPC47382.1 DUF86 domain-containing protein [Mangrovibacillus cuniculi]
MYFVDRELMEKRVSFLENECDFLHTINSFTENKLVERAVERSIHTIIEAILDIGNAMIDGFIMRDPGSYEDIIDIMLDERVITKDMELPLKTIIGLRKNVVNDYWNVDIEAIEHVVLTSLASGKQFATSVRTYLENELGPVTAFTPLEIKE